MLSCCCCCCRRSPDVLGSGPAALLPCRHASRLPDPDFASSPAGSTRGSTPPTPLSHPPPCPHHHHDIDIDIDIDVDMLLYGGPRIRFTYLTGKLKEYLYVRVAEVGSLSARAKMATQVFVRHVCANFATNSLCFCVIENLQIKFSIIFSMNHVIVLFLPKKHCFDPKEPRVFQKVRKSRQILISLQKSVCSKLFGEGPLHNFCHPALCHGLPKAILDNLVP